VRAYDPVAMDEAAACFRTSARLTLVASADAALEGADALLIVTEWKEFRTPDFEASRRR
jgi:UDPglucose 6-dehydrogenase